MKTIKRTKPRKRKMPRHKPDYILATNEINAFFHCPLCIKELPADQTPQQYSSLDVGYTEVGLQVWCKRHNCNVIHLDFDGRIFYASSEREPVPSKTVH